MYFERLKRNKLAWKEGRKKWMRKKTLIMIAIALIAVILVFLSLSSRGSVETIKHGYFPLQSNETTMITYKPLQYDIDDYKITLAVPDTTEVYVSSDK